MDNINLKNIKYIYYKNKNNIIKIETFGLIIKIGDVGLFFMKPRKDIIIYGNQLQFYNMELLNIHFIDGVEFLYYIHYLKYIIPYNIYNKLVINEFNNIYPYNMFSLYQPIIKDNINKILTYEQILDKYEKYNVKKYKESEQSLLL